IREQIEHVKVEIERAERAYDLNLAAQLKYGKLSNLERELQNEQNRLSEKQGQTRLLKEEVDEADITEAVSRCTCAPLSTRHATARGATGAEAGHGGRGRRDGERAHPAHARGDATGRDDRPLGFPAGARGFERAKQALDQLRDLRQLAHDLGDNAQRAFRAG